MIIPKRSRPVRSAVWRRDATQRDVRVQQFTPMVSRLVSRPTISYLPLGRRFVEVGSFRAALDSLRKTHLWSTTQPRTGIGDCLGHVDT